MFAIFERINQYRRIKRAERELQMLSDRALSDIGISRSEIHKAARGL